VDRWNLADPEWCVACLNEHSHHPKKLRMRRCVECGRPYRGGLQAPELLDLALGELGEAGLDGEHIQDLVRMRALLQKTLARLDDAIGKKADQLRRGVRP
jgi:hypothetical protein